MTDLSTLVSLRDRQKREHRASSRTNAEIYRARHEQLRRELRRERFYDALRAAAEFTAIAIPVVAVLLWAGIASLPV